MKVPTMRVRIDAGTPSFPESAGGTAWTPGGSTPFDVPEEDGTYERDREIEVAIRAKFLKMIQDYPLRIGDRFRIVKVEA